MQVLVIIPGYVHPASDALELTSGYHASLTVTLLPVAISVLFAIYIFAQYRKALQSEKRLTALVNEKDAALSDELSHNKLLMKEVTHRVKSNMSMVSAILQLQSFRAKDATSKEALQQGISRINSLAIAHKNLYQNKDFNAVNLKGYLNSIVSHISNKSNYSIDLLIPEQHIIDIEKAQALGFILNEKLSDSIKHAWPDEVSDKRVTISLRFEGDQTILTYFDNGVGFKDDYSVENDRSLGNVLISSFVDRQLNGKIETSNDGGAKTTITFATDVSR